MIRRADQRHAAALQQAGFSHAQARAGQYVSRVTANLDPPDRGITPSSSYRYPRTIDESLDQYERNFEQYERRQERDTSSGDFQENATSRDSQARERTASNRRSSNAYISSNTHERRANRNNSGR